jgi:hypothetical protein
LFVAGVVALPVSLEYEREIVSACHLGEIPELALNDFCGGQILSSCLLQRLAYEPLDNARKCTAIRFGSRRDIAHELSVEGARLAAGRV